MPYFVDKTEITGLTAGTWQTKDISGFLPAGVTGVTGIMVHYVNTSGGVNAGWRKNGSTDNRTYALSGNGQGVMAFVGVDASNQFQYYVSSVSATKLYFVGYFKDEAVFFTNGIDKTPGVTGSYQTIDISSDTGDDTAVAALFEQYLAGESSYERTKGSTDDFYGYGIFNHAGLIVGLDASECCEVKYNHSGTKYWLLGYIKSGVTMLTNATDKSLSTTGSYQDLAALSSGAKGGFFRVRSPNSYTNDFGLRKNGETLDTYCNIDRQACLAVQCDDSQIIEGKISNTDVDFWLIGYSTNIESSGETPEPITQAIFI